ncbi:MAG TPA: S53 family peptidase [Candidatus Aquilonibacter sp.]|nr:S53 family peptidase [Candidatus Aquilonibacter sp.]
MTASRRIPTLLASAATLLLALPMHSQKSQSTLQPRLAAAITGSARATLAGSQPPRARIATDQGAVQGSTPLPHITMYFTRTPQQQSDLDALIAAQQNPASPEYHQWLTPAQFGARFGLADADIAKVQSWLESQGFSVASVAPSRNSITFSGTASIVASAFGAPLHHYRLNGEAHIAPSADLTLPAQLAAIVSDVRGLSDFRPHPHVRYGNGALYKPNFTSSQTGNHFLTPGDVAVIYDIKSAYNAGYNGNGQTIAIMGQSAIVPGDITNFQAAIGQTSKAPTVLLVPNTGASQVYSGDESESDLDLEYAGGIAPGATIDFVYVGADEQSSVFDALTYAITNRIAPILNISYGECEADLGQSMYNTLNATLQQGVAQGQSIISAAGDDGSTDCYGVSGTPAATQEALAVDFPSSSQYVTGLGGTEFPAADVVGTNNTYFQPASGSDVVVSALSYIPEQAWNDDSSAYPSDPLSSGGGGVSMFTAAPSWQTGVPGIPSGAANRFVPDIALDASPNNASYAYCSSDQSAWASGQTASCNSGLRDSSSQDLTVAGGTSFAAPIFSGMLAIISQARGYTYQGLVNPTLYTLASNSTTYASAFHDITSGSNACNIGVNYCSTAGSASYSAGVGYDEATGLGSVDLNNLLNAWPASSSSSSSAYFNLSATNVSVTSGSSASSAVTITPENGYTGTINWSVAPTTIPNSCYSIASTSVTGTSAVTATISIQTGSSTCASGYSPLTQTGSGTSAALRKPALPHHSPAAPVLAGLGLLASIAFFGRRRNRLPALLAVLLAGFSFGLSGCGGGTTAATGTTGTGTGTGGSTGPTTTNYSVTIIGTDSTNSNVKAQATFTVALTTTT